MKISSIMLIVIGLCDFSIAQTYLSRLYTKDSLSVRGADISDHEGSIYIGERHRCANFTKDCGSVLKLDLDGNFIWDRTIDWIDFANADAMHIYNDTIAITGHLNDFLENSIYKLMYLNTDGDSIAGFRHELSDSFGIMFNYGTTRIKNQWVIYGAIEHSDEQIDGVFMHVDLDGSLDTLIFRDAGTPGYNIYDVQENANGKIVYVAQHHINSLIGKNRVITQVEYDGDLTEIYKSPANNNRILDNFLVLQDRSYVLIHQYLEDLETFDRPSILFISEQGTLQDSVNLFLEKKHNSNVSEIIEASNGDIVGCGQYTWENDAERIIRAGLLFRVNRDGELIWLKTYPHYDWEKDYYHNAYLADLTEMMDGSILATGAVRQHPDNGFLNETWLLKVSPNGCLHFDDCGFEEFASSTKDDDLIKDLIYPNPTSSILNIPNGPFDIKIFNQNGQCVLTHGLVSNGKVDVSEIPSGIYYLYLFGDNGDFRINRFVKN